MCKKTKQNKNVFEKRTTPTHKIGFTWNMIMQHQHEGELKLLLNIKALTSEHQFMSTKTEFVQHIICLAVICRLLTPFLS